MSARRAQRVRSRDLDRLPSLRRERWQQASTVLLLRPGVRSVRRPAMSEEGTMQESEQQKRHSQEWYEGYQAGMDDGADIGPSGALTWASIVGASIIIGLVILWLLSHNF